MCVVRRACDSAPGAQTTIPVSVRVNVSKDVGALPPVWAFFGYDEPNYTYMKDGQKLLSELAALSPVPVYIRAHNLLTTGDGTPALKWGSTNAYTEDAHGQPGLRLDDRRPHLRHLLRAQDEALVEIGFMPEALSTKPAALPAQLDAGQQSDIFTGWAYPPKDYREVGRAGHQWVRHCVERYGKAEVERWYWEVWNEPNIGYWQGTPEEYHKLYDYAADAVKRALPTARVGGPHSTGRATRRRASSCAASWSTACAARTTPPARSARRSTSSPSTPRGAPRSWTATSGWASRTNSRDIDQGFEIVASFPELKSMPIIIGESDPEGCAACSARVYPQNGYRNGTMYSSYTAATFARKHDLADAHGVNFEGA